MTLDDARGRMPGFGFAVYAYDPAGPVTVEVHAPSGDIFTATASTEALALADLFPAPAVEPEPEPEPEPEDTQEDVFS